MTAEQIDLYNTVLEWCGLKRSSLDYLQERNALGFLMRFPSYEWMRSQPLFSKWWECNFDIAVQEYYHHVTFDIDVSEWTYETDDVSYVLSTHHDFRLAIQNTISRYFEKEHVLQSFLSTAKKIQKGLV